MIAHSIPLPRLLSRGRPYISRPGDWHYVTASYHKGIFCTALIISAALHFLLIVGSNRAPTPARVKPAPEPETIQMVMPDLAEEKDLPVDELEKTDEAAGVVVPTLMDVPSRVSLDDTFVQPLQMNVPVQTDLTGLRLSTIPVKIARGGGGGFSGKIFDLAQLDRAPQPIVQLPPRFPLAVSKEVDYAEVVVDFVVNTSGDVRSVRIVSSSVSGLDQAVVDAVLKWTFRPGMKGGRKVNAHIRQPFHFKVTPDS